MQIPVLVHSYLMKYQPFNLRTSRERARIAYETGDYRTAIEDIRNYFNTNNPSSQILIEKEFIKSLSKRKISALADVVGLTSCYQLKINGRLQEDSKYFCNSIESLRG